MRNVVIELGSRHSATLAEDSVPLRDIYSVSRNLIIAHKKLYALKLFYK